MELPDELTKLILVRLSAIELNGCKFVSKLWLSLISSPDFISDHINRSKSDPSNHLLLLHYDYRFSPFRRLPDTFRSMVFFLCSEGTLVGSANGLICIVGRSIHPLMTNAHIWILNPVTGHILKLQRPPKSPTNDRLGFYNEGAGRAYFVFWWDSVTDEYKLAKIVPKRDSSNTTLAYVWVSGSPETWSEIPVGFHGSFHRPAKFVSGCDIVVGYFAYWIVFNIVDRLHTSGVFVLSLDLKTLSVSLSKSPFPLHPNLHYETIDSLFSCLASSFSYVLFAANWKGKFVLAERVGGDETYDVWAMDTGEGWSKECSIDYPILNWINDVNGKTVVTVMVDTSKCGIALYDIGTGEAEPIEDFLAGTGETEPRDLISGQFLASAHDFVGSLVSIEGSKPLKADDDLSEHFRVIWPDLSAASRMSGNSEIKIRGAE